jgi:putative transposase
LKLGESRHTVAERLGVSGSCVLKWLQRLSRTGSVAPGRVRGHVKATIAGPHRDWVLARSEAGDVTLHSLAWGVAGRGLKVDAVTVWTFLRRKGKRFKDVLLH